MSNVIIFSTGVVREKLIGPEIRVWEFAKNLFKKGHDVTLAVPNGDFPSATPFRICQYHDDNFNQLTKNKDVAVVQGDVSNIYTQYAERIPTVYDLYDPYIIECLHLNPGSFPSAAQTLKKQILTGDFFLCASETQRVFYLGMFSILKRLDPSNFPNHQKFENLIDLVPFGASKENLSFNKKSPNPGKHKVIFLGGVYNWYNPFVSLDSLRMIRRRRNDVKFMFIKFPYDIPAIRNMEREVLEYSGKIGVGGNILFGEWVPYEKRGDLYSGLDIALVMHKASLESMLSFRTRNLDFLSFGVPIITNAGGDLENLLKEKKCGIIVEENNPEQLANTIVALLEDEKQYSELVNRGKELVKEKFLWEKVIEPLERFCRNPAEYNILPDGISSPDGEDESLTCKPVNSLESAGIKRFIKKSVSFFYKGI